MVIKVVLNKKDASQNMAELGIKDITLVKVSTTASSDRTYIPGRKRVCELMIVGVISHQK
jgi:hypothetical protein